MNWWQRIFGETKRAFDLVRVGIVGLPQYPSVSIQNLQHWHRRNELVYACVRKIAEAALDPEIQVERRAKSGQWEVAANHPLRRLLNRPNPLMDGAQFLQSWLVSEQIAGVFYAEIVRNKLGQPVQLWPLDPAKVLAIPAVGGDVAEYEFRDGSASVRIPAKDLLVSRLVDLTSRYVGLSPLAVCLGSVEADSQQTDYVRAFFQNSGVPSGIIKVKGVFAGSPQQQKERAESIVRRWVDRYGWGGKLQAGPVVLDDNADYQKIGAGLDELENQSLRAQIEARICMVFGVPPLLVGAYVGLLYVNQRGTARAAHEEFWMNTMSPMLRRIRSFLTWNLLPEWEGEEPVAREEVRTNWNLSQVMALQEEIGNRSMRAREDFRVGGLTLNEFRAIVGLPSLGQAGDYYLRPVNRMPVTSEVVAAQLEAAANATEQAVSVALTGERTQPADEETGGKSRKAFSWDGFAVGREPTDYERRINVKALGEAMDNAKADVLPVLVRLRSLLIDQAAAAVAKLDPKQFHTLVLDWPQASFAEVAEKLRRWYLQGQSTIRAELEAAGVAGLADVAVNDAPTVQVIADALISRALNDVQARAVAAAARLVVLETEQSLADGVKEQLTAQSSAYLGPWAAASANAALSAGRSAGGEQYALSISAWIYSAVLDRNTCETCREADGLTYPLDSLPPVPNPQCGEGYGACRCVWIPLFEGE